MQTLDLVVARVAPRPPPPPLEPPPPRLPRPDDPTPREPPLILFGAGKREPKRLPSIGLNAPAKELKRAASSSNLGANPKRKKLVNGEKNEALFKVPEVPVVLSKSNAKGKRKQTDKDEDVFGDVDIVRTALTSAGKLKVDEAGMAPGDEVVEMERANKNVHIKLYSATTLRSYIYCSCCRSSSVLHLTTSTKRKILRQVKRTSRNQSSRTCLAGYIEVWAMP